MSPKTKQQFNQQRESTRQKILQTTLQLFALHGYEKTSIRMIAGEAKIALGLLYSYFPSKEAVLQAIFKQSVEDIEKSFLAIPQYSSFSIQVEHLIDNIFGIIKEHLSFWQLFYSLRMQPSVQQQLQPEIATLTSLMLEKLKTIFGQTYAENVEAEIRAFIAVIDGIGTHYAMDPANYPLPQVIQVIKQRYCSK